MPTLYSQPSVSYLDKFGGTAMPKAFPQYSNLGNGLTDRIFLIGHGPDSMAINDPYQVVDIREAVNKLEADADCPLLRGLMELYYGGARDIFLVSAAPMSEYEPDITRRDDLWYQNYANELQVTYDMLLDWDLVQILVPLNAPYFDSHTADFLTPLVEHCARAFDQRGSVNNSPNTGNIRIGLIGTKYITDDEKIWLSPRGPFPGPNLFPGPQDVVDAMVDDPRLELLGEDGKFVAVIVGEGVVNLPEMPTPYMASLHTSAAAELCQLPYNRSLTYTKLRNTMSLGLRFSKEEIDAMSEMKLNVVDTTTLGWRNVPYETVILTDNTLGVTGSDFWSLVQVRLSMHIIQMVRALGRRYLGSVGLGQFKQDIQTYLVSLIKSDYVRDANCIINRDLTDSSVVNVDITFTPYFGIRQINFSISIGPTS